jgi:uncharacterized RDD family membrane protein YckC
MHPTKVHQLLIRTPEGITFSYALAGPVTRSLAWILDAFCISMIAGALAQLAAFFALISPDFAMGLVMIVYFVVWVGYGIVLEWAWGGQTVGKRVLRLRVMDQQGLRLRFSQIVLRNLLRAVDSLPLLYLVGGVVCLFSRHAQRLGDLAAGTIVARLPKISEPDLAGLPEEKFNSLLAWPHLAARLRQEVTPAEAALAMQALMRREGLELEARLALYHELAEHFQAKVPFPQEATDGVSDEHYLRNVLGIVFRSQTAGSRSRTAF